MDLHDAAYEGDLDRVQLLLGQGVDKDEVNSSGYTALFWASWKGNLAVVQCLVDQGADKDKASWYGSTPLDTASHHKMTRGG